MDQNAAIFPFYRCVWGYNAIRGVKCDFIVYDQFVVLYANFFFFNIFFLHHLITIEVKTIFLKISKRVTFFFF